MITLTREEYARKHPDFKGSIDGQPTTLCNKGALGTCLEFVRFGTFVREEYPWGRTPTYRLEDGTLVFRLWSGEETSDMQELRRHILDRWSPAAQADLVLYDRMHANEDPAMWW